MVNDINYVVLTINILIILIVHPPPSNDSFLYSGMLLFVVEQRKFSLILVVNVQILKKI